jgi:DNA-binding NarL/FixJ family response regulator
MHASAQDTPRTVVPAPRVPAPRGSTPSHQQERVSVAVHAQDLVLRLGVLHQLRRRPEVELLTEDDAGRAGISLVVVDTVDEEVLGLLQRIRRDAADTRIGMVVGSFDTASLPRVVGCGVTAVLRRAEADQDRLLHLVLAMAKGEGVLPGDLLGILLTQAGNVQRSGADPRGLSLSVLTGREADMLRLVAEGFDTAEIAQRTGYSERTVKNVLHEVSTRLQLRNRAHAVGFALRNGLI